MPAEAGAPATSGWRRHPALLLGIEFAPLVIFFLANERAGFFVATAIFIAATIAALIATILLVRRVSPILAFNFGMVLAFGGLTLVLHDDIFMKVKPTVDYTMFAAVLVFGLATGRLFLKQALGALFPDLADGRWRVLTRNWAIYFVGMAIANELVWRFCATDIWVAFRVWVPPVATLLYGLAHVPYLLGDTAADPVSADEVSRS